MLHYIDEFGDEWEIDYIVTQAECEGPDAPEYMCYRKIEHRTTCTFVPEWQILPPWAEPNKEIMEHFFGPVHE